MQIEVGGAAPDFQLKTDNGSQFHLADEKGKKLLLVFYPGNNTPVCTAQLCDYRDGVEAFTDLGVEVVGISNNNADSHQQFKAKHELPFRLLTDANGSVAKKYGAWGLMGTKRAVFLIDEAGLIQYAKVESVSIFRRHREELLKIIQATA